MDVVKFLYRSWWFFLGLCLVALGLTSVIGGPKVAPGGYPVLGFGVLVCGIMGYRLVVPQKKK